MEVKQQSAELANTLEDIKGMSTNSFSTAKLLNGNYRRVHHVMRFSSVPCIKPESVAAHTFNVAFIVRLIAEQIMTKEGKQIDIGMLLTRAIMHDLDESMTGDFVHVVKYQDPEVKKRLDKVGSKFMKGLLGEIIGNHKQLLQDWQNAKAPGLEGAILKVADYLSVQSYLIEEMRMGNRLISYLIPGLIGYLGEVREKYLGLSDVLTQIVDDAVRILEEENEKITK